MCYDERSRAMNENERMTLNTTKWSRQKRGLVFLETLSPGILAVCFVILLIYHIFWGNSLSNIKINPDKVQSWIVMSRVIWFYIVCP